MNTSIKTLLILMIAALGFYNLKISKTTGAKVDLTLVESSASADPEVEEARKYLAKQEESGSEVTTTVKPDGTICKKTYDFVRVLCTGTGNITCTPKNTISNEKTTC
ncbi:hypothetical protein [Pedobacter miscanthi]|uniref:Uncharacterized protein n=1 Tax=Pedobacter miscanthi TaxID=2259170 RepID=A0A366KLX1_9SPHI|nr:hypothetical protein [Pedobacter miscanthi]RBQ02701.1 hypothetical protein DRW42_25490 [Pedobacter miscanthi]